LISVAQQRRQQASGRWCSHRCSISPRPKRHSSARPGWFGCFTAKTFGACLWHVDRWRNHRKFGPRPRQRHTNAFRGVVHWLWRHYSRLIAILKLRAGWRGDDLAHHKRGNDKRRFHSRSAQTASRAVLETVDIKLTRLLLSPLAKIRKCQSKIAVVCSNSRGYAQICWSISQP
jgi:hypothetical protein